MNSCQLAKAKFSLFNSRVWSSLAVLVLSSLTLTACGKDEEKAAATGAAKGAATDAATHLLSYAPTGAPYLAANLEPTPDEVIDSFLKRMEPLTANMQSELEKKKADLEARSEALDTEEKLTLALVNEFNGKLNRAGLESLGLDLSSEKVIYGFNAFPVLRSSLSDATALRATVQRVLDNAGITSAPLDFQGKAYWKITDDSDAAQGTEPESVYIAILDDHVVAAVYPASAEAGLLPHLLGIEKPASSDAAERLANLNGQYSLSPYGTGVVDFQLLANEFFTPDSLLSKSYAESEEDLSVLTDPVCQSEIRGIISHTPRFVAGTTELTANAFAGQYVFETDKELAQQLVALVADVPAAASATTRLLEFSLGINVGAARDFLRSKVEAVTLAPYQCSALQDLNTQAQDTLAQLDQPIPPLVNNFRGLRISLDELTLDQALPPSAKGLLAVHVDQPEMVVGMAQMFVPDLAELKLVKGEPPVALPASMIPVPDVQAFAALGESSLGIGVGPDSQAALVPYLEMKSAGDGSFLSVNYDSTAFLEWSEKMDSDDDALTEEGEPAVEGTAAADASADELSEAARKAFQSMAGRSEFRMRFTPSGLVIDNRMTFKE